MCVFCFGGVPLRALGEPKVAISLVFCTIFGFPELIRVSVHAFSVAKMNIYRLRRLKSYNFFCVLQWVPECRPAGRRAYGAVSFAKMRIVLALVDISQESLENPMLPFVSCFATSLIFRVSHPASHQPRPFGWTAKNTE